MAEPEYYGGGWWITVDPATSKPYYYNSAGESSWIKPLVVRTASGSIGYLPTGDTPPTVASPSATGLNERQKSLQNVLLEAAVARRARSGSSLSTPRDATPPSRGASFGSSSFSPSSPARNVAQMRRVHVIPARSSHPEATTARILHAELLPGRSGDGEAAGRHSTMAADRHSPADSHPVVAYAAVDSHRRRRHTDNPSSKAERSRRSSLELVESGLVQSVLQQAASEAGAAPKVAMLHEALDESSEDGYVSFSKFSSALSTYLGIDDPTLQSAYFRGFQPVVKVQTVMARLTAITHGSMQDAISFAWDCYANPDGFVEAAQFVNLAVSCLTAQAKKKKVKLDPIKLRSTVASLFLSAQHSYGEALMSKEEFEDFVLTKEPELLRMCAAALGDAPHCSTAGLTSEH